MSNPTTLNRVLLQTDFPELTLHARGKVRDLYSLDEYLLFVATDRISAFDYVLGTGIPEKGRVLTQISLFWFDFLRDIVSNHLVTANVEEYPAPLRRYADQLRGRSMLVNKAQMVEIECVVRGYISGSAWKEYQQNGTVCGIQLPRGLRESDKLPEPIFTPATKALSGHDENISFAEMCKRTGTELAETLRDLSLKIYTAAADYAAGRGIIIADTKFEFGHTHQGLVLPDSGLLTNISQAGRRNLSTSNLFATIWKRSGGTNNRRRLLCRMKLPTKPVRSTYRHMRFWRDEICRLSESFRAA